MVIAVVSDTHRSGYSINKLKDRIKSTDVLIHLGDNIDDVESLAYGYNGRVINVRGNCDFSSMTKSERLENICDKRIFITHGHRYNVKYDINELIARGNELNADIVLYGHTHESKIDYIDGTWYINPGSPSLPRDGFASYATIEITGDTVVPTIVSIK